MEYILVYLLFISRLSWLLACTLNLKIKYFIYLKLDVFF